MKLKHFNKKEKSNQIVTKIITENASDGDDDRIKVVKPPNQRALSADSTSLQI
jgi:hypothetical protein